MSLQSISLFQKLNQKKRYERVIDKLKKMVDTVRKQTKATAFQFEREIQSKTELEYYLKKAVDKVYKEKKKQQQ